MPSLKINDLRHENNFLRRESAKSGYYGQKGGEIINAAGVLQFDGDWGFALCFGSPAQIPGATPVWYPDFTPMMNIAKSASWSSADLFTEFGMPSL